MLSAALRSGQHSLSRRVQMLRPLPPSLPPCLPPGQVASDAVAEARAICFREYGGAPPVSMLGNSELTMAYVPSHLHHMVRGFG